MNPISKNRLKKLTATELLVLTILLIVPFFINDFLTVILTRMLILGLLAISFELCWGYSGIMTFGQGLFFGMAGYSVALFANKVGFVQIWGVIPIGIITGGIVSFLIAWLLLLGKKPPEIIFVALGTLTFSYAMERLVSGWYWVGGGNGMSIFDYLRVGSYEIEPGIIFYYLAGFILLITYLISRYIVRSQFGLVLAGTKQNEKRLLFLGYRVKTFKALVFTFAGAVAGLGGALYAHHEGFIGPNNMGIGISTMAVLYTLLGGAGTLLGPVIGVIAIETISFTLSDIDAIKSYWPIVLGVILLLIVTFKPDGLMSLLISQRERIGSFGKTQNDKSIKKEEEEN